MVSVGRFYWNNGVSGKCNCGKYYGTYCTRYDTLVRFLLWYVPMWKTNYTEVTIPVYYTIELMFWIMNWFFLTKVLSSWWSFYNFTVWIVKELKVNTCLQRLHFRFDFHPTFFWTTVLWGLSFHISVVGFWLVYLCWLDHNPLIMILSLGVLINYLWDEYKLDILIFFLHRLVEGCGEGDEWV